MSDEQQNNNECKTLDLILKPVIWSELFKKIEIGHKLINKYSSKLS